MKSIACSRLAKFVFRQASSATRVSQWNLISISLIMLSFTCTCIGRLAIYSKFSAIIYMTAFLAGIIVRSGGNMSMRFLVTLPLIWAWGINLKFELLTFLFIGTTGRFTDWFYDSSERSLLVLIIFKAIAARFFETWSFGNLSGDISRIPLFIIARSRFGPSTVEGHESRNDFRLACVDLDCKDITFGRYLY